MNNVLWFYAGFVTCFVLFAWSNYKYKTWKKTGGVPKARHPIPPPPKRK